MRVALLLIALCCGSLAHAESQTPLEVEVKAAYIYRFLDYVTWPSQSFRAQEDPIVIGTLQNDEVAAELARLTRDRTVQGRRLQVVVVKDERDPAVHVLYVSRLEPARTARALEAARQRPILVVTDLSDGLDRGGVINFVPTGGRIQFEVSLEAAARAGLEISSRLLAVARRVKKGEYRHRVYAFERWQQLRAAHWLSVDVTGPRLRALTSGAHARMVATGELR
jgi:hypothetical protein